MPIAIKYDRNHQVPGSLNCIYFLAIARIVVIKWKPACVSRCTKIPKRLTQKAKAVFKQRMQIFSSWNITSRMLQPYYPNSVIIQLYFLWLPSVLQPSKQAFAYEVTERPFRWKRLCSRLLFKPRKNNFLLCRASLLRLLNACFDARVDLSPSWNLEVPWGL